MAATVPTRIGQISLNARDLKRAVTFYRDVVGLRFLFEAPPQLAFFECGGVRLMLSNAEIPEHDHPGSILYYVVEDIKGTARALTGKGAVAVGEPHFIVRMPTHDLWLAEFRDTEGNTFALMAEREHGAT
jgi:predicted enzyme related to lactoylglutathione lyase